MSICVLLKVTLWKENVYSLKYIMYCRGRRVRASISCVDGRRCERRRRAGGARPAPASAARAGPRSRRVPVRLHT